MEIKEDDFRYQWCLRFQRIVAGHITLRLYQMGMNKKELWTLLRSRGHNMRYATLIEVLRNTGTIVVSTFALAVLADAVGIMPEDMLKDSFHDPSTIPECWANPKK